MCDARLFVAIRARHVVALGGLRCFQSVSIHVYIFFLAKT